MLFGTGCFVYYRNWSNLQASFPLEEFAGVHDDEVRGVLKTVLLKWAEDHPEEIASWRPDGGVVETREPPPREKWKIPDPSSINEYLEVESGNKGPVPTLIDVWDLAGWYSDNRGPRKWPRLYVLPGPGRMHFIHDAEDDETGPLIAGALRAHFEAEWVDAEFATFPKAQLSRERQLAGRQYIRDARRSMEGDPDPWWQNLVFPALDGILADLASRVPASLATREPNRGEDPELPLEALEKLYGLREAESQLTDQEVATQGDVAQSINESRRGMGWHDSLSADAVGATFRRLQEKKRDLVRKVGRGWTLGRGGKTLLGTGEDWVAAQRSLKSREESTTPPRG